MINTHICLQFTKVNVINSNSSSANILLGASNALSSSSNFGYLSAAFDDIGLSCLTDIQQALIDAIYGSIPFRCFFTLCSYYDKCQCKCLSLNLTKCFEHKCFCIQRDVLLRFEHRIYPHFHRIASLQCINSGIIL